MLTEAVRLLGVYTANSFDVWRLAGPAKAGCRAHVMSELLGKRTPQSKSGVNAIIAEFYRQMGIDGDCDATRSDNFAERCREHLATSQV